MDEGIILLFAVMGAIISTIVIVRHLRIMMVDAPEESWLTQYHYAHRGLHGDGVPENSLAAFSQAIQAGYGIELDVRLSRDGRVVVFHDSRLTRMTGKHRFVKALSLSQIKKLRLAGTDQSVPTLEEVLELVDGRAPLLFEIKNKAFAGRLEKKFYGIMKHYKGRYAIQSFSPFSVRWFMKNAPDVPRGQLACDMRFCGGRMTSFERNFLNVLLLALKHLETNYLCRPNFISYEFHDINRRILKKLRMKGALVIAWTICDEDQLMFALPHTDAVIFESIRPH